MSKSDNSSIANIHPTPGYLFIEPEDQQTKTVSGIYLPDSAKGDKPQQGIVIAAGSSIFVDGKEVSAPAKVKQVVLYKKWGGNEVKIDRKEYLFVKFEDILAVIS